MYNANYMDGVPVKIAEKYKPPPPIYKLPLALANRLNLEQNFYWNCPAFSCDLHLQKMALPKIEQWKCIRQHNKEQRKERILKRDEHRKREDEDRQKNLLYCVSYPSTDDLSSEDEEKVAVNTEHIQYGRDRSATKETATGVCVTKKVNSFHNILQPTVLSLNSSSTANRTPMIKSGVDSKIPYSFNYKDFEEDTSSPFDNIELKTINDLDILAQVLHSNQLQTSATEKLEDNAAVIASNSINQSLRSSCPERDQRKQIHANSLIAEEENIPVPNRTLPQFSKNCNSYQGTLTHLRECHLTSESTVHDKDKSPSLSPVHLCNELNNSNDYRNFHLNMRTNKIDPISRQFDGKKNAFAVDQITKSKSVPDILKELKDEIRKSEIRRDRNCSYNKEGEDTNIKNSSAIKSADADNENVFSHLDDKAKQLVEKISAMGFPIIRVARIVQLVGTDDKKVVEHLIPLSELIDLGFEEVKISDALIRNENNKNKALDDLIS